MLISLAELNALDRPGFVAALDGIYEGSTWVAEAAINAGPFRSRLDLLDALNAAMLAAPRDTQQVLIDTYPDLLTAEPAGAAHSDDAARERRQAGLDTLPAHLRSRLATLTADYRARFGFRCIIALCGHDPLSLIATLGDRLDNDDDREFALALHEIGRIAAFRLARRVTEPAGDEALTMCSRLAWLGERRQGLICTALTPAHRATAALLRDWMLEAGLAAEIDALGNVVGRRPSLRADARTVMIGSHYDSAPNGGPQDGRLGIVLALAVARRLRIDAADLSVDLEIVAFSDRHGLRFGAPLTSARALAGQFDPMVLARRDADGITFAEALQQAGHDPVQIPGLARDPARIAAFIEIQPEHGPTLQVQQRALGVVSAILGLDKQRVQIAGQSGHAGCVPRTLRHDAVAAAAEVVLAAEAVMQRHPGVVATVGRISTPDGAVNSIADRCELSLDLRAADDDRRAAVLTELHAEFDAIASRRGVTITRLPIESSAATRCAPALNRRLSEAVSRVAGEADVLELPAGARHDAAVMAALAPTAMLLVRSGADRSVAADDAHLAASALREFLLGFVPD